MEIVEDVVIVGAGIAGLTTSLGLHRLGLRSLVLESSDRLRITGFAFTTWINAWKALDAVGLGESLREQHDQILGIISASTVSGLTTSKMSFKDKGKHGYHEVRCLRRKVLLEALEMELPPGTIRYSSKVVSIQDSGYLKLVHLADGSILKAKGVVKVGEIEKGAAILDLMGRSMQLREAIYWTSYWIQCKVSAL